MLCSVMYVKVLAYMAKFHFTRQALLCLFPNMAYVTSFSISDTLFIMNYIDVGNL